MSLALLGLNLLVAEKLADQRQRHAARNQQRRESGEQIVDADARQIGLRPDIFIEPLDVLKRLAFRLARKHLFAIVGHAQPDRAKQRGSGCVGQRPMQTVLLCCRGGFDPDCAGKIEMSSPCAQHFAAPLAGPIRIERGGSSSYIIG